MSTINPSPRRAELRVPDPFDYNSFETEFLEEFHRRRLPLPVEAVNFDITNTNSADLMEFILLAVAAQHFRARCGAKVSFTFGIRPSPDPPILDLIHRWGFASFFADSSSCHKPR
jgi:hypothetical protein